MISKYISDCVEMWLLWMKNYRIANNKELSTHERYKAVMECERLIGLEYEITGKIDKVFEQCQIKNN